MRWQRKQGNLRKNYKRSKKEKWTGAKSIDPSCCNHGSCPFCESNRTHDSQKIKQIAEDELLEDYIY